MPKIKHNNAAVLVLCLSLLAAALLFAGLFVEDVFFARALIFMGIAAFLAEIPVAFFASTAESA